MKKAVLVFLFIPLVLLSVSAAETPVATTPNAAKQLKLIPEPKEIQLHAGSFRVTAATRILVEIGHQAEDRIAAETLAEEIHDQSGLKLSITGTKTAESRRTESKEDAGAIVLARLQDRNVREFLESKGLKADSIGDQG